ncbi:hypothetical protein H1C71_015126, partial [Ictidomys tridecemlineatus]
MTTSAAHQGLQTGGRSLRRSPRALPTGSSPYSVQSSWELPLGSSTSSPQGARRAPPGCHSTLGSRFEGTVPAPAARVEGWYRERRAAAPGEVVLGLPLPLPQGGECPAARNLPSSARAGFTFSLPPPQAGFEVRGAGWACPAPVPARRECRPGEARSSPTPATNGQCGPLSEPGRPGPGDMASMSP